MAEQLADLDFLNNYDKEQAQKPMANLQNNLQQGQPQPQQQPAQNNNALQPSLRNLIFYNPAMQALGVSNVVSGATEAGGNLLSNIDKLRQYLQNKVYSGIHGKDMPKEEGIAPYIQKLSGVDITKPQPVSRGIGGQIEKIEGEMLPFLMTPEANLPGFLGGKFAGQVLPQAAMGALTSEDPVEGAISAGQGAAIGAAPGLVARTVGRYAEAVNPLKTTQETMDKLKDIYQFNKGEASKAYNSALGTHGASKVTNIPENFLNYDKATEKALNKYASHEYNAFIEKPTLQNLHDLQSKVFSEGKAIRPFAATRAEGGRLLTAREDMLSKLKNFLEKDPEALGQYQKGADITRTLIKPQEINRYVKNISKSKNPYLKANPQKLLDELNEALGSPAMQGEIAEGHPMKALRDALEGKMSKASQIQGMTDIGLGSLIGSAFGHPVLGGLGGLMGMHKLMEQFPAMLKVVQNPQIESLAASLAGPAALLPKLLGGTYKHVAEEKNKKK